MERVYLLLRNNVQTGPFTIGELLQQQLRPSDMIWIEGKSSAWTYLSELELTPFVKNIDVPQHTAPIKTEDEIERKAEELRQRTLNAAPKTYFPRHITEIESYASPYKLPEDEIEFIDVRKERRIKKNTVFSEVVLTCFVIGLFMAGIYKGKSFLGAKHKVPNSVATQLDSHDQHAAQKNNIANQAIIPAIDTTTSRYDSLLVTQKTKQKPFVRKAVDSSGTTAPQPVNISITNREKKEETDPSTLSIPEETPMKKEILKKEIVPTVPEIKTNNEPVKEEKRGFLKGLFKKKKKDDTSDKTEDKNN